MSNINNCVFVTCYCDASFKSERGHYAVWLKSNKGRIQADGDCPSWIKDSNAAELYAIYEGVKLAIENWADTIAVLVCSDSTNALRSVWPWTPPAKRKDMGRVEIMLHKLIKDHNIEIKTKHVKGHKPQDGSHARWLNRWCDKRAGRRSSKK